MIESLDIQNVLRAIILLDQPTKDFERGCREFSINGKLFRFPCNVFSYVVLRDRIYVGLSEDCMESLGIPEPWRTVCCYDSNGNLLWRAANGYYIDHWTKKKIVLDNREGGIDHVGYWPSEDKLVVYGRLGYEVDPETGELGEIVYRER
jgi:hypothetical protein